MGFYNTSFIRRHPALTASATVALAVGAFFLIKGPVTGVAPVGDIVFRIDTGSGAHKAFCDDTGECSFSGSLTSGGTISGSSLQINNNATIDGTLIISGSFDVVGTSSGDHLHAERLLTSSGTLTVEGIAQFDSTVIGASTLSGSALQIDDNATIGGTATVTGNVTTAGNLSGATLNLNGGSSGAILCFQTDGSIGTCSASVYGAGVCNCT